MNFPCNHCGLSFAYFKNCCKTIRAKFTYWANGDLGCVTMGEEFKAFYAIISLHSFAVYHVETTLCAYNLSCLAGHGVRQGAERAQDDCNFGYFSTRLALLWHEAIAIPLIQVIFCPTCLSSFDGPHLFLGNNEQRAKKQRPGAGGTIFCQNI